MRRQPQELEGNEAMAEVVSASRMVDDFFEPDRLRGVALELPPRDSGGWTTWDTTNEWKHVFDQPEHFGPNARQLADELNGSELVRYLERLTGIAGLVPDPHLTAAGYFDVRRGGFLNVHVDFARNPKLSLVRPLRPAGGQRGGQGGPTPLPPGSGVTPGVAG